jgi:hypothetical protein
MVTPVKINEEMAHVGKYQSGSESVDVLGMGGQHIIAGEISYYRVVEQLQLLYRELHFTRRWRRQLELMMMCRTLSTRLL